MHSFQIIYNQLVSNCVYIYYIVYMEENSAGPGRNGNKEEIEFCYYPESKNGIFIYFCPFFLLDTRSETMARSDYILVSLMKLQY